MNIDLFCQWFEGKFDNWTQAASNPTKWAHIIVEHKKIGDYKYLTSSRYSYMDEPYTIQEAEVTKPSEYAPNLLIVKNPACDMLFRFHMDNYMFYGESGEGCTWKDRPLESQAKLYSNAYHTWDKGYWEGSEGFFTFDKVV